jgi:hypothetical protein
MSVGGDSLRCPKCGAVAPSGAAECPSCGVILAKARPSPAPAEAPQETEGKPAEVAGKYRLRRDETDYDVPNLETLREWARAGRIAPTDYVYNPTLERWVYARELGELEGELGALRRAESAKELNKAALACFIASLVTALWAPGLSGLLFLATVVLVIVHYAKR